MTEKKIVYCKRCGKRKYSTICQSYECKKRWKKTKKIKVSLPKLITPTGELLLFQTIWNTRPRVCFISGVRLKLFTVNSFAHILPKGNYKHYKLYDRNIVLMTPENHHAQHNRAKSDLIKENERWKDFFLTQDALREEYNRIFK